MNKEANKQKSLWSHITYDDLPKKCWVDEKRMNKRGDKPKKKKKVCDLTFYIWWPTNETLMGGWMKDGWTESQWNNKMFVISHKHDDDDLVAKKGWVAEKWMDREPI